MDVDKLIQLHLGDPTNFSIFPQLANIVSNYEWIALACIGITPLNYTTNRILKENSAQNSLSLTDLLIVDIPKTLVEPDDEFYSYTDVTEISKDSIQCLKEALGVLNEVKSLYSTIKLLVRNLHILKSRNDEVDVSYSLPNIPFSIFISLPSLRQSNDFLRVAEGILHETMHLQLSLLEKIRPLVKDNSDKYFSPWKGEYRSINGILHALYVFKIIQSFYRHLMNLDDTNSTAFYVKRIEETQAEIKLFQNFERLESLTNDGNILMRSLIKN